MSGGADNDTYVIDDNGDTVTDASGTDTVQSNNLDLDLGAFAGVENATLLGLADKNLTGNGDENVLIGNDGSNKLDGGAGSDTLIGGAGNDTYIVDNPGDTVTEAENEGIDTVQGDFNI